MNKVSLAVASFAVAGLALASAAQAAMSATDAHLEGSTLTLNVDSPEAGWAVIHKISHGKPAAHIGHALVHQGENKNVVIQLDEPVKKGERLIVMLHEDKGQKDVFEFGPQSKADAPAMENGKMVTTEITAD